MRDAERIQLALLGPDYCSSSKDADADAFFDSPSVATDTHGLLIFYIRGNYETFPLKRSIILGA